jgi:hypothetical protein
MGRNQNSGMHNPLARQRKEGDYRSARGRAKENVDSRALETQSDCIQTSPLRSNVWRELKEDEPRKHLLSY